MEQWVKLALWIGAFGFFKEFRPEDPYIIQYMTGPELNFTDAQVNQVIFPVSTYTSMIELVFVFLITDWLRYKPVVVVCALSGVIVQVLLIWCRGISAMQIMEVFYGTMGSTEVAYYTYIYAKVDPQYFQQVTSYMRGAVLSGRFLSSVVSQVFLISHIMNVSQLNYLTLVGMVCALIWALGLPSVPRSLYFHRDDLPHRTENGTTKPPLTREQDVKGIENGTTKPPLTREQDVMSIENALGETREQKSATTNISSTWSYGATFLWEDFKFAFTKLYVLKWSAWVALGTCCYLQVMSYVQILWETAAQDNGDYASSTTQYNGAIEAVYTLTSATSAVLFGKLDLDWTWHGDIMLGILTVIMGALVTLSSFTNSVLLCYAVYIVFGTLYHVQMTVAYSEIAKHIKPDSYALVFGVNSFVALVTQTILVYTVAGEDVFALPIRLQFKVYGSLLVALGGFYAIIAICNYIKLFRSRGNNS